MSACPRRPVVCLQNRSNKSRFSKWTIRPPFLYWHIFTKAIYLRTMAHTQMHDCFQQIITNCVINVSILTCGILGHCGVYSFWASIIETGLCYVPYSRIDACTLQPGILDWTFGNPSTESADLIFHEL